MKKKNLVKFGLKKLINAQIHHPGLILLAALVLSVISIFYTVNNLGMQTSQKDLISPKEHLIQLEGRTNQFEKLDSFIVVIEGPEAGRSRQFLHKLVPVLEADKKNFEQIFYRVDPNELKPWALLYLDEKDILNLADNLQENRRFLKETAERPTLDNFFAQINHEMSSRMVGELFTGFLEDGERKQPMDLEFLIRVLNEMKKYLEGEDDFVSPWDTLLSGRKGWDITQEGYFWTKDKKYLLVFVTPRQENDFSGTKRSLSILRKEIQTVQRNFADIKVGVTGPEALNTDQMGTARDDMELATIISLVGLTLLFIIFRRSIRRPIFEMITLTIALSWCFGLITLFIGHLNILSITFAPLILGLGIDNGAHWFARYQEEENSGRNSSKRELMRKASENIGPGILLAGVNLAVSFLPLTVTGFKGLAELGVICFLGLIATTLATLIILPSLIMLFDHPVPRNRSAGQLRIEPLFEITRKRILYILAGSAIALGLSLWQALDIRFDLNMLHLQSPKVESVVWEHKLLQGSELSSIFGELLVPTLEAVKDRTRRLEALPSVSRVESVDDLLPQDQKKKLKALNRVKPVLSGIKISSSGGEVVDIEALEDVLSRIQFKMLDTKEADRKLRAQMVRVRALVSNIRQKVDTSSSENVQATLRKFESRLIRDLGDKLRLVKDNVNARPMTVEDLPIALRERFVSSDRNFLIRIFPKGDIWDPVFLDRFVHELREVDPDIVGDPVTLTVFTQEFRNSMVKASLLSIALMFAFLLIAMRKFKPALLTLLPLLIGTAWTFGLMRPFGIHLNLANSIFLPLIVGAGVEYGIIIVSRWRQKEVGKADSAVLPSSTAWGVVLAGLTTTVGFGSLMISSHQGIFSLGLLTSIGSLAVLAAAVILLPAVLGISELRIKSDPERLRDGIIENGNDK